MKGLSRLARALGVGIERFVDGWYANDTKCMVPETTTTSVADSRLVMPMLSQRVRDRLPFSYAHW